MNDNHQYLTSEHPQKERTQTKKTLRYKKTKKVEEKLKLFEQCSQTSLKVEPHIRQFMEDRQEQVNTEYSSTFLGVLA